MAQLIVAAAGAAIGGALLPGFAFLGITGAGLGWAVGSAIGAGLGPSQKVRGPRLEDLRVTGTEYGQPIPYVQGHPRVAGQIWWASDKREIATTTEQGKGGPSIETTTYTYEVDVLIGLTDNPIQGVARVWSNGKLVWTKRADSGAASALSGKSQTSWRRLTVYPGADDQMPDPTYEAAVGVGNAPAYRGRGSVFIEGLQLGAGGQLPNLTFEVYTQGDEQGRAAQTLATFPYSLGQRGGIPGFQIPSFTQHCINLSTNRWEVYEFSLGMEETRLVNSYAPVVAGFAPAYASSDVSGTFLSNTGTTQAYWYDDDGTATSFTLPYNINNGSIGVVFCRRGTAVVIANLLTTGDERLYRFSVAGGTSAASSAPLVNPVRSIAIADDLVYAVDIPGPALAPSGIYVLDLATMALQTTLTPPPGSDKDAAVITDELGNLYCFNGATGLYRLDGGSTWTLVKTITGGIEYGQTGTRFGVTGGDLWAVTLPGGGNDARVRVVFDAVSLSEPSVRTVVDNLLARTGIDAGKVDTSALASITTPVRGLAVGQVTAVRSVLEQLGAAYFFEAFLADKLRFVPRGGASAATIAYSALGATDGQPADDPLPIDATPDEEIPAQVAVSYANADADYNTATEHSDRLLSNLTTTSTVQLPLVLTSAEAKGIADAMVQDGYAARLAGAVQLDVRHLARTPTDVVTLTDDDGSTYRVRLVRRRQQGLRVEFDWVSDDASALASAGVTSGDYAPSLTVALPGPTTLALMDIPILRDADDAPGIYAAAKPTGSTNWPGAKLMGSTGGDYSEVGTFTSRAVFGTATVALTNWTGGNVFDEGGSVTVDVGAGTLSSATRDALLNTDANAMLVGAEVIQFRDATLVTPGVYKLTGLLRGRRGTEHAMTGHTTGETCVLLRPAGLVRVSYDAARIGVAADYKAVTLGTTLARATARSITDTGVALKPFAPVNLRAQRDGSRVNVTWDRRTRLSYRWPSTSAVPLGEAAEAYDVELLDGPTLLQTVRVSQPLLAITGAREVDRLSSSIFFATVSGGVRYGISTDSGAAYLLGIDSAGLVSSSLLVGDSVVAAIEVGGSYYVSAYVVNNSVIPAAYVSATVYRIDLANPGVIAAQRSAGALSDTSHLAHDGTHLWITERTTGTLRKLDASTLASVSVHTVGGLPVGLAHAGGVLYYFDSATSELVAWDIATTTEVWREAMGATWFSPGATILVKGSLLFVAGVSGYLTVRAVADGALVHDYPDFRSDLRQVLFVDADDDVLASQLVANQGFSVLRLDGTTGALVETFTISNGPICLIDGDVVYVREFQGTANDFDAVGYELIPDLTGYTVRVYQISATVGRGYPASLTL